MINPFTYAEVCLEIAQRIRDDDLSITRADYRNRILILAERAMNSLNITDETEDLDELLESWVSRNDWRKVA